MEDKDKQEYAKKYLMMACDHMTSDFLLDAWWGYLADNNIWYSNSTKKRELLTKMDATHLYNIRNIILKLNDDKPSLPQGAAKLVSTIDFLMMKCEAKVEKDKDERELPF